MVKNAATLPSAWKAEGLDVAGDPAIGCTETHPGHRPVGYAAGPEVAARLERNNIIAKRPGYLPTRRASPPPVLCVWALTMTPLRLWQEGSLTFLAAPFIADCVLRGKEVGDEVVRLRSGHTQMYYCFQDDQTLAALGLLPTPGSDLHPRFRST